MVTILVSALVLAIVVNEYFRTGFILELKKHNYEVWEELGKPSGYFSSYLLKANGFALERFIFNKRYTNLNSSLSSKGRTLYFVQIVYISMAVIFIGSIIAQFILLQ